MALERAGFVVFMLGLVTLVSLAALLVFAPRVGLTRGLSLDHIVAATVATGLMSLVFASVALSVGSPTGTRSLAISSASTLTLAGFVVEGLGAQGKLLNWARSIPPWHWLLHPEPLHAASTL